MRTDAFPGKRHLEPMDFGALKAWVSSVDLPESIGWECLRLCCGGKELRGPRPIYQWSSAAYLIFSIILLRVSSSKQRER
jgi:hypothetical protein